ncbi:MAG: glycosyltransferase [Chloroflexi bacterium]|nr:MAG: glycosyltransferase [Chloroflexota bacterium]
MSKDLRVVFISDMQGHDDEGMKKIARRLSHVLNEQDGFCAEALSPREALSSAQSFDIMHYVGGPTYRSVMYAGWFKSRVRHVKTILSFTNPFWNQFAEFVVRLFPPNCVVVQSRQWQEWAERLNIFSRLMSISGVDIDRFTPVSTQKKIEIKTDLGFPTDKKLVLHVGHLKEDRNVLKLIPLQAGHDIQVVVIGSTTTEQSKSLIAQLEEAGCIVINQYQPAIEQFYQAADCYVFPTVDAQACIQLPLSVYEAMATNLPVVTTRFGGLPDILPSGEGLYYGSFEHDGDMLKMVRSALTGPINTRGLILMYDWPKVGMQLAELYRELVRGSFDG